MDDILKSDDILSDVCSLIEYVGKQPIVSCFPEKCELFYHEAVNVISDIVASLQELLSSLPSGELLELKCRGTLKFGGSAFNIVKSCLAMDRQIVEQELEEAMRRAALFRGSS